jgi:hypothetical protein
VGWGGKRKSASTQNLGLGSVLEWVLESTGAAVGLGLASGVGIAADVVSEVVLECALQWSWVESCGASWSMD